MEEVTEGGTKFYVHAGVPSKKMPVFYNPVKEYDRRISIDAVKSLKPSHCIDLLCASGARGLRLMREAGATDMTFNDSNPQAIKLLRRNLKLNGLKARVFNKDANTLLYDLNEYFDYIDLDPFGSPNPYLETAVRFLQRRGVLAVTATDTAVLVGAKPKTCLRKYHASALRHPFMKETGLRILIKHVVETGAESDFALSPVLSHSTAHYFRAYFIKDLGAKKADELLKRIVYIYYCSKCGKRGFEPCNHKECIKLGPVYAGSINQLGILPGLKLEDSFPPWHYTTNELVRLFRLKDEPRIEEVVKNVNGMRCHYEPKGFKTKLAINEIKKALIFS